MAYLLESGSRCQSCGTAPWEWEEDRYAYEPSTVQCWGCYLKELAGEDISGMAGGRTVLVPKAAAAHRRLHGPERRPGSP